jgi:hypothetical protein
MNCRRTVLSLALGASLMSGCTTFNPYQQSDTLSRDLSDKASLAGELDTALLAVDVQRQKYMSALNSQARARAVTATSLIALATGGLYEGLRSGVASDNAKRNLALAGGLSAGAYSSFNFFVNPSHEKAYLEGFKHLTCSIAEILPLSIALAKATSPKGSDSLEEFAEDAQRLEDAHHELDKKLAQYAAKYAKGRDTSSPEAKALSAAYTAAYRARATLGAANGIKKAIQESGYLLRREAELIVGRTSESIRVGQSTVATPQALAAGVSSIVKAYRDIKVEPEALPDAKKSDENEDDAPPSTGVPAPDTKTPAKGADPAPSPNTPVKDADLATLLQEATKKLQVSSAATAAAAKKSASSAAGAAEQAKRYADDAKNAATDAEAACIKAGQKAEACKAPRQAELLAIVDATTALYMSRRPVSQRVQNFYQMRKTVRSLPGCGSGSLMSVNPSADADVKPGVAYEITINNPEGFPTLSVVGDATGEVVLSGSLFVARVTPKADAKGVIKVKITDTKGGVEEIDLTVKPAAKSK